MMMEKDKDQVRLYRIKYDLAEAVSSSTSSAKEFLIEEGVDYENLIKNGIESIEKLSTKQPKESSLSKKQLYFRRVVLAGEIAKKLHGEQTFGHVKFQKLMFLSEKICKYDLKNRYLKQAAGPMDHRFMHTIDKEFNRQNWFEITREGKYKKFTYSPLSGLHKQQAYYEKYYSTNNEKIQWLIETFQHTKTDTVELVATLFACWEELLAERKSISDGQLIKLVYGWSKEKKKYSESEIQNSISWMKQNNLCPDKIAY